MGRWGLRCCASTCLRQGRKGTGRRSFRFSRDMREMLNVHHFPLHMQDNHLHETPSHVSFRMRGTPHHCQQAHSLRRRPRFLVLLFNSQRRPKHPPRSRARANARVSGGRHYVQVVCLRAQPVPAVVRRVSHAHNHPPCVLDGSKDRKRLPLRVQIHAQEALLRRGGA
jgi:hypothetical protein